MYHFLYRFPLLSRFLGLALIPTVILVFCGVRHIRALKLDVQGAASVSGLSQSVKITRDRMGVPTITAKSEHDVYFATGYLHAQDRLWQMEVQRRIARGRLSELFGSSMLERDIWMRTLSLETAAQSSWDVLTPEARASLVAYADGVNAWINSHDELPPEFAIVGIRPSRWEPIDSLAWMKVFSLNLSGNMSRELARFLANESLSAAQAATFFSENSIAASNRQAPVSADIVRSVSDLARLQTAVEDTLRIGGRFVGSNAWVVGATLTNGDGAILANDPHLQLQIPSLWYPLSQAGGLLKSAGMSLVGLPLIVFGHNRDIAWGGTSMPADTQDLYFEQTDALHPKQYAIDDAWHEFAVRKEVIDVKADFPAFLRTAVKPIELYVRTTCHGPVVSDALGLGNQAIALRWVALQLGDTTYESILRLNHATDWKSFKLALSLFVTPTLNMLYADRIGNIGYLGIGRIPVRTSGNGTLPQPAGKHCAEWSGFIPWAETPQSYNPPTGYIVSANDNNIGAGYRHFISADWASSGRADRINELISEKLRISGRLTVDDFKRIQADVVSLPARKMINLLRRIEVGTPTRQEALYFLTNWDGSMSTESAAATIFTVWTKQLTKLLFEDRVSRGWKIGGPQDHLDSIFKNANADELYSALTDPREPWCRSKVDFAHSECAEIMLTALDAAVRNLKKVADSDMSAWHWGHLHYTYYGHIPFSRVNFLKDILGHTESSGGAVDTINVANAVPDADGYYQQTFGASFRQIIQMGDRGSAHWYMNSTGQSGNVFSRHYADMSEPFAHVEYASMEETATSSEMLLLPTEAQNSAGYAR